MASQALWCDPLTHPSTQPTGRTAIAGWQVTRGSPDLDALIHHRDHLQISGATASGVAYHRVPDGLVYLYATGLDGRSTPRLILKAASPGLAANVPLHGAVAALVLRPHCLGRLAGIPAHELGDRRVPLDELWGRPGRDLLRRLMDTGDAALRLALLEQAVRWRLAATPRASATECLVRAALHEADHNRQATAKGIANRLGVSPRRLQRAFAEEGGIGLKRYLGIQRFRRAFSSLLHTAHTPDLCRLALATGYADQAHLSRDIVAGCGLPPSRLRALHSAGHANLYRGLLVLPAPVTATAV